MDVFWETEIFRVLVSFCAVLSLRKKKYPFCFWEWSELLSWSTVAFLCYKRLAFTSLTVVLTLLITLLFLQPLRALQPSSQPVQFSAVSYPPPLLPASSAQHFSVVLHLLFSAPAQPCSAACSPVLGFGVLWQQGTDWLSHSGTAPEWWEHFMFSRNMCNWGYICIALYFEIHYFPFPL